MPECLPLFVASGRADRISRPGLAVCRHDEIPRWELVDGVRVTSSGETLLACARDLGLLDVVVLGDAALHAGDVSRAELVAVSRLRRRGAPRFRRAIPLMDGRAESIYEGLLRILHRVCQVAVEPQYVVLDEAGDPVARTDLRRVGRISDAGFERRGYTKEDVLVGALSILRDADRALGRPHEPARIEAWHDLLRESLFSGAGRHRLMRRLGLAQENAEQSPR
jgi:hypothetical protein